MLWMCWSELSEGVVGGSLLVAIRSSERIVIDVDHIVSSFFLFFYFFFYDSE